MIGRPRHIEGGPLICAILATLAGGMSPSGLAGQEPSCDGRGVLQVVDESGAMPIPNTRVPSEFTPGGCPMSIYLDNTQVRGLGGRDGQTIDDLVRPHEIAGVEIYMSVASLAAEFAGSASQLRRHSDLDEVKEPTDRTWFWRTHGVSGLYRRGCVTVPRSGGLRSTSPSLAVSFSSNASQTIGG